MGANNYTIAEYKLGDSLVELQRACLPSDVPETSYPQARYWVARGDAGLVSFIIMRPFADCWYLSRAGTLPEARGQHLYPRLLRAAFTALRKAGVATVITDCAYWNTSSANGLIRAGFKLWEPARKWGFNDGLYWRKEL